MPSLFDEMTQYLHRWRDELPTAWCGRLDSVEPNFDAIPRNVLIDRGARIVPARRNRGGVFHALEGIDPSNVVAIVIGNDPYPDPCRATGRSFEQGDLTDWNDDLAEPGRVTPSLLSLVCAVAALLPDAEGLGLDRGDLANRREKLLCGLRNGQVVLPSPWTMFENLTGQGVLWLNRTLTISAVDTGTRRRGSSWQAIKKQRKLHRALWCPVTHAIVSSLVEEARRRLIVVALFGGEAKNLRKRIQTQGRCRGVPRANLRFVKSGHPSWPQHFFCCGNPLGRINDELIERGCDSIDWCSPTAGRTAANDPPRR